MTVTKTVRHPDGTRCLEGTRRVPRRFKACCRLFESHTATCAYDIRYEWWQKGRTWVVTIAESAGGGGIEIRFCPHCGRRLSNASSNTTLQRTAGSRRSPAAAERDR